MQIEKNAGCDSPEEFLASKHGKKSAFKRWIDYRSGAKPLAAYGQYNPIAAAEEIWPGCSATLDWPIWAVLDGGKLSQEEAIDAICELRIELKTIILAGGFENYLPPLGEKADLDNVFVQLALFPGFDLLKALILMLAWMDALQSHTAWNHICWFYHHMIPDLIRSKEIPFHEEMFDLVDHYALRRDINGNYRRDHFKSWRDELPRYHAEEAERERLISEMWEKTPKRIIYDMPKIRTIDEKTNGGFWPKVLRSWRH